MSPKPLTDAERKAAQQRSEERRQIIAAAMPNIRAALA